MGNSATARTNSRVKGNRLVRVMRRPSWSTAALLLLAVYLSFLSLHPVTDDFWVNVVVGREMVRTGSIPDSDVFSYAVSDRPWLPHMWLSRVLMSLVDGVGGLDAIRLMFLLITFGYFVAAAFFYRLLGLPAWGVALGLCFVFAMSLDRFRYRPIIFTMAFLYAGCAFLVVHWPKLKRWHVLALYLFTALWVNLHSGGLIFPLVVCALAGADVAAGVWRRHLPKHTSLRLTAVVATVLGSLTTPYSFRLWIYVFEPKPLLTQIPEYHSTLYFFRPDQFDQLPLDRIPLLLAPWLVMLLIAWPVLSQMGRSLRGAVAQRIRPVEMVRSLRQLSHSVPLTISQLVVSAPLLYLAVSHIRFMYMAGIPFGFLLARYRTQIAERNGLYDVVTRTTLVCLAFVSLLRGPALVSAIRNPSVHLSPEQFPLGSTRYLREQHAAGRLFCYDTQWNGYLLYHLYPQCQTFCDTRHMYGGPRIPAEAREIHNGTTLQSGLLRRYGINIILAKNEFRFAPQEVDRWELVYRAKEAPFDAVYFLKSVPPTRPGRGGG